MKNKKGFTLIELLAVIVVLGIIMTITTRSVVGSLNESKQRAKYMAAKEIVNIASAYMAAEGVNDNCILIEKLIDEGYLESDVTNPETGENIKDISELDNQMICKVDATGQTDYELKNNVYVFDNYVYKVGESKIYGSSNDLVGEDDEGFFDYGGSSNENLVSNNKIINTNGGKYLLLTSNEKVDVTYFNKLIVQIKNELSYDVRVGFYVGLSDEKINVSNIEDIYNQFSPKAGNMNTYFPANNTKEFELDLKNITGEKYINIYYSRKSNTKNITLSLEKMYYDF